jgi:hypothetical protein
MMYRGAGGGDAGEAAVVVVEAEVGAERRAEVGDAIAEVVGERDPAVVLPLAEDAGAGVELAADERGAGGVAARGGQQGAVGAPGELVGGDLGRRSWVGRPARSRV